MVPHDTSSKKDIWSGFTSNAQACVHGWAFLLLLSFLAAERMDGYLWDGTR